MMPRPTGGLSEEPYRGDADWESDKERKFGAQYEECGEQHEP